MALTAYQKHTKKWMKRGKTMAQAARLWDKKKGKPKSNVAKSSSKAKTAKSTASNTGGSRRMGDPFSPNSLMKWSRRGALFAPMIYTILERGVSLEAGKEIVRKYFGYDGAPIRGWGDLIRVAQNLAEGYGTYIVATGVTTAAQRGAAMLRRFMGG